MASNIITITSASKTKSNFAFGMKLIPRVIIKVPVDESLLSEITIKAMISSLVLRNNDSLSAGLMFS